MHDPQLTELIDNRTIEDDQGLFSQGNYSLGKLYHQQQRLDLANNCLAKPLMNPPYAYAIVENAM